MKLIGQVVNYRYEVLEKSGDGSYYSVYKARDKVLNRLVAVKVLGPQYSLNREFAERLTTEAQNVTELAHPNIARVLEADSQNGTYFTAVEYVRGINLKDRIRRVGTFAVSYAVDIAFAVSQALEFAHRQGLVHGDVRPHNIITSPEGQVKLTDFGMAKALAAFPQIREATMLRSVHYMAPEVIRGEPAQPASDVYSLGVVLYEMLTGSVPYDGVTSAAIAARQLQESVPSPQARNSGVPTILNEIVMKAMNKDPRMRFANAAEFAAALNKVREWQRTGTTPLSTERQKAAMEELVYEPERQSENFLKNAAITLLGVLVVAVIAASIMVWFQGKKDGVPVPDLIGKTLDQARAVADSKGLILLDPKEEYNDQYAAGQVFMTDPKPGGTVSKSKPEIRIWISKGPRLIVVPNLIGLDDAAAASKIVESDFLPGQRTTEYNDTVPVGHIIKQTPTAGSKREPGKTIDRVLSLGPKPEEIQPDSPYNGSNPDEDDSTITTDDTESHERKLSVKVTIPEHARGTQRVQIIVKDDYNEETVYDEEHEPGDIIDRTFVAYGEHPEMKVYINNRLVQNQIY